MALQALKEIGLLSSKQKDAIEQRMLQIMEEIYYYNNDNQFVSEEKIWTQQRLIAQQSIQPQQRLSRDVC